MEVNERNSADKIYYEERILESCLDQISLSDTPKLSILMLSLMLENGWHASLPLKVFHTESQGEILIRGECCNTLGVCHQLSNGFNLNNGMLSSDGDVRSNYEDKPNLNLDHAPLLTCCPFQKVCLSNVGCTSFMCVASISIYIDPWKSFVKFGIKKSHEMTSYVLA